MTKRIFVIGLLIAAMQSCKKEEPENTRCNACDLRGTYSGMFHQTAGCYGCTPYLDSIFAGNFTADTIHGDSIIIIRAYDNYEWKFAYNDTGNYSRWGCFTV